MSKKEIELYLYGLYESYQTDSFFAYSQVGMAIALLRVLGWEKWGDGTETVEYKFLWLKRTRKENWYEWIGRMMSEYFEENPIENEEKENSNDEKI